MSNQTNYLSKAPATSQLQINTSTCNQPDAFDIKVEVEWFNEWIVWQGGITFNVISCFIILILTFAWLYICRRFLNWRFLSTRFVGEDPSTRVTRIDSWIDWLTLKIDEEAVGKDGATFLWFQFRLIQVETLKMALGIVLICMHYYDDKLGESPKKTLRSTGLANIGVTEVHGLFCSAILFTLAWLMKHHGQKRSIRSLASYSVNNFSSIFNPKWLIISGLEENTTVDSLLDYLKSKFHMKGIHRDGIVLAFNVSKLLPIVDQLKDVRNIKQNLSKTTVIKRPWWKFWDSQSSEMEDVVMYGPEWTQPENGANSDKAIEATTYYKKKEEILLAQKEAIMKTLEFTGTVFIGFDSQIDAKTAKMAIRRYQTLWKHEEQDDCGFPQDFQPSKWTVRYAPPSSDIDWMHLIKRRPTWKIWAIWLRLALTYSIYVIFMAAPGSFVRWVHLYGEGEDRGSTFWKRFILPAILSFFTTKLTDWVTGQDQYRRHLTVTQLCLSSLRSICYLNIVLYLIRMMTKKPLPLLLAGKFHSEDFRLECLFFPVHGSFVACCIIANTVSVILMNHLRLEFIFSYIAKLITSRSEAEMTTFKNSYKIDYDFAANYAEITSNFALASFFYMIFPVISLVSCVFSILRFFSDRSIMTDMYAVSQTGHNLHQESINMALIFAVASPLALLMYRGIQLGPTIRLLYDPSFVLPLCLMILYFMYLLSARVKSSGFLLSWFSRLFNLQLSEISTEASTEEDEMADSMSNIPYEYDPLAKIRAEELIKENV